MKSELVKKGWIRRTGRHAVELLVGNFPAPVVREISGPAGASFGKNPNGGRSSFGKNPNEAGASFGKNPNGESGPLTVDKKERAAAPAARGRDPLSEPVDDRFLAEVIAAGVYAPELVRWVYGKLKLHALAAGAVPVRKQLLHWLGREEGSPPVQAKLFEEPPGSGATAGNFGGAAEADNTRGPVAAAVRPPAPDCQLCRGLGDVDGRACSCVLCPHCYGAGMEVIAGKGARRCRCRLPRPAIVEAEASAPAGEGEAALDHAAASGE